MSHSENDFDPKPHRPSARGLRIAGFVAGAVLVVLVLMGLVPRLVTSAREERRHTESANTPAHVVVHKVLKVDGNAEVTLPGSIEPLQETTVYARTNGYVKRYFVDIGDKVHEGQALAELDTPDINQEFRQAEAMREQAHAVVDQAKTQLELARITANRYEALGPRGVVSQQELEERQAGLQAQQANLAAAQASMGNAEANLRRLSELKSFATVHAPFDGVVTSRTMETGQLVVAGTGNGQPIAKVMRTSTVRVFVNVPQLYAPAVEVNSVAPTRVREFSGRVFDGKITRTANALDPASRTLLTEVRIDNPNGTLIPGMYAQVALKMHRQGAPLLVPSTAVMANGNGLRVAAVQEGHIHWRDVEVDADMGPLMALATGVAEGDEVVVMPSERLTEGMLVVAEQEALPEVKK